MNNDLISRKALKIKIRLTQFATKDIGILLKLIDSAPTVEAVPLEHHNKIKGIIDNEIKSLVDILDNERPQGESVIKCQDCKYRVKEWREDKRMKEKGYWVYGCKHFGEIMGYWGFGGNDNEFCSDAERKGGAE